MTLAPGTRLGSYEILSPLGAGGMGEVYSARDSRLGREVAIKVLPAEVAADPDRLARFEREAKAVSALNHPHIVTLYELGASERGPFLVLEKIEGGSLRELLRDGALPVKRVLTLGAQIAEGLAKAHSVGIVHRDLKPDNVMVSEDGFAKILDFGLAKLVWPELEGGAAEQATTLAGPTASGMVLGTPGYLSPEQAAGRPADFRADQFALGALLYEMATGERPFRGASTGESLAAVLRDEPEPLRTKNPSIPAPLGWLVERCLAKDPADRYGSTRDLARDLADLRDHLSEISRGEVVAAVAPPRGRWLPTLAWSALGAAAAAIAAVAAWVSAGGMRAPSATAASRPQPTFEQLTFRRGHVGAARFAPDGETVVYSAAWGGEPMEPFLTRLDSVESRGLAVPGAQVLAVSSSGELAVALGWTPVNPYRGGGTLARLPLVGGAPRELLEGVSLADWAPDGKSLAVLVRRPDGTSLEFPIGKAIYAPAAEAQVVSLRVSPRGDRVAIIEMGRTGASLVVIDLAGKSTTLSQGWNRARGLAWAKGGEEIWFTAAKSGFAHALYAVGLGGEERLVARVPGSLILHDIGSDGSILLTQDNIRREISGLAPGESEERDLSWLDYSWPLDLSEDGRTLLFAEGSSGEGMNTAMYLRATDGSPAVRLGQAGVNAELSPDGRWILNAVAGEEGIRLEILPTGAGESRPLEVPDLEIDGKVAWFPDGRRLLFVANEKGRPQRTFAMDVSGGEARALTPEGVVFLCLSPDGERLVGSDERERSAAVYPIAGGTPTPLPRALVDDPNVLDVNFAADSRSLYTTHAARGTGRIERWDLTTGQRTPWRDLHATDPAGVLQLVPMDVSSDGKSYVYTTIRILSTLYRAQGLE